MTGETQYVWQGDDWEEFCFGLLQDRHGAVHIHKVPSRHKGDYGLDYYCQSDATAYQCYAVQEPVDVPTRAKKQKNKITSDLKKLCSNSAAISAMLGGVQVQTWVLLAPLHDSSDVNVHLGNKSSAIRTQGLPHLHSSFTANINDLTAFDTNLLSIRLAARQNIELPLEPAEDEAVQAFQAAEGALFGTLSNKLLKRAMAGGFEVHGKSERFVGKFIERENALEKLRGVSPQVYEKIRSVIGRRTEQLEMMGNPTDESAAAIFRSAFEDLVADIKQALPALADTSAEAIAMGTLSDWLMRCPLDFPPYVDAD